MSNVTFPMILTNVSLIRCQFINNSNRLIYMRNRALELGKVNVFFTSLNISYNLHPITISGMDIILILGMNVYISGTFNATKNRCELSIMHLQSCDISLHGKIIFSINRCGQVIFLDTYIKIMEYTNITFKGNAYKNNVISIKENAEQYSQPYSFCLIQYIAVNDNVKPKDLSSHYSVSFTDNNRVRMLTYHHIININGSKLHSQNHNHSILFCHYMSHCRWLPLGAFHGTDPETVNREIVNINDHSCSYQKHICYCPQHKHVNCSIDILGTVYPGQTLQTNLCAVHTNDDSAILYAKVHNINLPNSTCKIAHQSQLVNAIGYNSNTVNYTIVSSIPKNNRCEIFLTATPYLDKIYDVYYVELLHCPIGFTLQDGKCGCDPILLPSIDKCYIDNSTIRRPLDNCSFTHT